VQPEGISKRKIPMTPPRTENRYLPACSAIPQTTEPPRTPYIH